MLQCGRKYVSSPPFVPESGSQLYHAVFDRRAGERDKSAGQGLFRDAVVANGHNNDVRKKNAGGDPVGPRPRLQAVRPAAAGGSLSVVHEMTLVQDLRAAAHQRGQVLVCVVAAEVQLATRRHRRTNPGASAAGIATICRIQLRLVQYGAFKSLCVHASITHHHPAPRTPVHPGRNRPPARRHNETGEWKSLQRQPQEPPKRHPPARSGPGLVNRGKRPRTRATRTVGHKRAPTHI